MVCIPRVANSTLGRRGSNFLVSVHFTHKNHDERIKPSAGSRSKSTSQTRVQLERVKSHHAVIQLGIAAALARAARTRYARLYHSDQVWLSKPIRHSSSQYHAFLPCDDYPRPIHCFGREQFSKRRATSAINYISVIKVPTPDLVWPAQPRSPDFCVGRRLCLNWHQLRKDC